MIVMKFGGASLADAETIKNTVSIIESRMNRQPVVVVSAFGKTTDLLTSILESVSAKEPESARKTAEEIGNYHLNIIGDLIVGESLRTRAQEIISDNVSRLRRLIDGMEYLEEVSPRTRDSVLATGEMLSAPLFSLILNSRDIDVCFVDPCEIIRTDTDHGRANPCMDAISVNCRDKIIPELTSGKIPVTGGFLGSTPDGAFTTLGRGGSDLTASLVARGISADLIEFWKDVDGILTADPGIVPDAEPVSHISFQEAGELAFLGAKVLHPSSIQPAVEKGIPVRVLNFHKPSSPGTLISDELTGTDPHEQAVSSVACKRNQLMVNVYSTRMLGARGFLRTVFEVFDRLALSVDHIATSEVNVTVTLAPTHRVKELETELSEVAKVRVEDGVGVVSVVGRNLPHTPGVAGPIFNALSDVNIKLVTYGGSGVNLSIVVADDEVEKAVKSLHTALICKSRGEDA
ncbi:aspartate kinase [candidate division WOR-3 bacterium]|uniref:Aspartokinase n=1 Tax=candidate division WOR-3 bacterium TaxID=2052148 RepID=A0A9D5KBD8_UNCW3|nr:aspartate kinase [candidate division WOR-3 bacterium]MBD3365612.1 aspartate kinase [candidate division WOR-3 bacterium]